MTSVNANSDTDCDRMPPSKETESINIEELAEAEAHLRNTSVQNIVWKDVTVTVRDRATKQPKVIVDHVNGQVQAGELVALMGPSGSGKTTLLNVLARRPTNAQSVEETVLINGTKVPSQDFKEATCFVEQEDHFIGSLTVRETLHFASRLSTSGSLPAKERILRIEGLLKAFGLVNQANTLIGTPIRKGISGGQKRRVSIASQLITSPKIIFLDEPTSGLDSRASFEVVRYLRGIAKRNGLLIIASIHQPSTTTFDMFDKVLLLSGGKTHYFGPVADVPAYYEQQLGMRIPVHENVAEWMLDQVNIDFSAHHENAAQRLAELQGKWAASPRAKALTGAVAEVEAKGAGQKFEFEHHEKRPSSLSRTLALFHRNVIKSYRDVIPYGVRFAMYVCLGLLIGLVWLDMDYHQDSLFAFKTSAFYGAAFLSFMAIAYLSAYQEDLDAYKKEKQAGLYGPGEFLTANFLIGVIPLFLIVVAFSAVSYWLMNLHRTAEAFFSFVLWLFLDLLAAEGLVILVASICPFLVISLAVVAFANGLFMAVAGGLFPVNQLPKFWKYGFSYWDYQRYVYQNMIIAQFKDTVYDCETTPVGGCHCMYQSDLEDQCKIRGTAVLDSLGYRTDRFGQDVGIMIAIIVGYRLAAYIALKLKKN